jgi:uncharacterized protein YlxW (UPF0749 family)
MTPIYIRKKKVCAYKFPKLTGTNTFPKNTKLTNAQVAVLRKVVRDAKQRRARKEMEYNNWLNREIAIAEKKQKEIRALENIYNLSNRMISNMKRNINKKKCRCL